MVAYGLAERALLVQSQAHIFVRIQDVLQGFFADCVNTSNVLGLALFCN